MIEGFEVIGSGIDTPRMSVTKNGVLFNKAAIEALGKPAYALALLDTNSTLFAIQTSKQSEAGARKFYRNGANISNGIRWNSLELLDRIARLAQWNLDNDGYRVSGKYDTKYDAIVFNLKSAVKLRKSTGVASLLTSQVVESDDDDDMGK